MYSYNISYELASVFFMVISIGCLLLMRRKRTDRYKKFLLLMVSVLMSLIFDILGALSIGAAVNLPRFVPVALNTVYFVCAAFSGMAYLWYAEAFVGRISRFEKTMSRVNLILFFAYVAVLLLNVRTGWIFYFDSWMRYTYGPYHWLCYIPTYFYLSYGLVYAFLHYRSLNMREMLSLSGFVLMAVGTLIQVFLMPDTLCIFFFGTLGILAILLFMETPDYAMLQDTLAELDSARIEAEKASRVKKEFLLSISREIKNPMNTVLGMDEMIINESNDDYITGYAKDIRAAGNSLMDTFNKILDYADLETGRLDMVEAPYRVSELVRDIYNSCIGRAEKKGLTLNYDVGSLVPDILVGDAVRIREMIVNLVENGIKFTPSGSVTIFISHTETEKGRILLEIKVSDTGIGIKKEDLDTIFGTVNRVADVRTRSGEGIGLGLAIVTKLADMMNGEVKADSVYGKGSVFTVLLPQTVADPGTVVKNTAADSARPVEGHSSGPLFKDPRARVLIADDNDINRAMLMMLLKETEVITHQVSTGEEMLEVLSSEKFDVVLLDRIMPDMDGADAVKRALEIDRVRDYGTRFIAITADSSGVSRGELYSQGFEDAVSKPVDGKRLEEAVKNCLDKSKTE